MNKKIFLFFLLSIGQAFASADKQSFGGGGLGIFILSRDGSGTGIHFQAHGGYNFDEAFGLGLHTGYSNVGGVQISVLEFGGFLQWTGQESGIFSRFYLDGVRASVNGGGSRHGVSGAQMGVSPGAGIGLLIPSEGDFHFAPEIRYNTALLKQVIHLFSLSFNLIWDF